MIDIYVTREDGQHLAVQLWLRDGNVEGSALPGHAILLENVLARDQVVNKTGTGTISKTADPAGWLKALPYNYTGSYVRAAEVPDKLT